MISIPEMRERAAAIRRAHTELLRDVGENQAQLAQYHEARKTAEAVASIISKASDAAQMRFAGWWRGWSRSL